MAYQESDYAGDAEYTINATGDCVTGDEVRFERATFSGSYRNAKFTGFEMITGRIVKDSYGRDKQQHTFTIEMANGSKMRIKGRNLYRNGVYRKEWADESKRQKAADKKHARGDAARKAREIRQIEQGYAIL